LHEIVKIWGFYDCYDKTNYLGCGSGKYLSINPTVFNTGSDRCKALTEMAREKEHEVKLKRRI